jgi:glycosyltransferase involved in cell wall biosynthesis
MKKRVAIVYDRVNKWGGAERVLLALHEIFPEAPLYTSVYDNKTALWAKVFPKVYTSFLQNIPLAKSNHEFLGTFMPLAYESFSFDEYDIVISVTSEAAKGIKTKPSTKHICYCLTPTRYLWSAHDFYFRNPPRKLGLIPFFRFVSMPIVWFLRIWDRKAAKRPDVIIAISTEVKNRIKKYYKRDSEIIFPPVNTTLIHINRVENKKYYLVVNRLVPYKRVDLAINAFNELGYPLYVVGTGSEEGKLKGLAKNNIKFFGQVNDKKLAELYSGAKALIMPQEEDFGIVAVEAQSFGVPVIAYKKGGAVDTVINGKTGILFDRQTTKSLIAAVKKFEKTKFVVDNLYTNAERFSKKIFKEKFGRQVKDILR